MRTFEEINADIASATSIKNVATLKSLVQELETLSTPEATAAALNTQGILYEAISDYPQALEHYRRAQQMYEEVDDRAGVALVASNLGSVYHATGDDRQALECHQRALQVHEELGDRSAVARVTGNMGTVYQGTGDYPRALEHYRQALQVHKQLSDRAGAALVTGNMGIVYSATGDYPQALECYQRALQVHVELGHRSAAAHVTGHMGIVYQATGDYPRELEHYERALAVLEELGDRAGAAVVTGNMGIVYGATGDYSQALECHQRALQAHEELGHRTAAARVTGNIGVVHSFIGDQVQALEHFRRALQVFEEHGDRADVALLTGNLIKTPLLMNHDDEATDLLQKQSSMVMDHPSVSAEYCANRAVLAEHQGDLDAAWEHLQQALQIVREAGEHDHAAEYHEKLRDLAQKRNDFAGFIEHNAEFLRIIEEIRGKEATQKMAMMEAERKMDAERLLHEKERALLYGALPESVATRMLRGEVVSGDHYERASVLFLDIVGFTTISDRIPAGHVVHLLKAIFKVCDETCATHGLTKIKTIGDSYLAVAGVPDQQDDHTKRAAQAAIDMMHGLNTLELTMDPKLGDTSWTQNVGEINVRIGLHCGPLVAGIVGEQRLQYDVWGDTVNVVSRMESTGEPGRIQVSEAFMNSLVPGTWHLVLRGDTEVKGKGTMKTYWLEGA